MQASNNSQIRTDLSQIWARRILRKFAGDHAGVTAIEFALIALPFFTIVFAIIELGLAFLVNRMVDNAVIEASRMIRTGQAANASFDADKFSQQICNSLPDFLCSLERIRVNVSVETDFTSASSASSLYDEDGNLKDDNAYKSSNKSEIVAVNVIYVWPMFTSLMNLSALDHGSERHLSSTMVFRNEPW